MINWKGCGRKAISKIFGGMRRITENLCQNSPCPGRDPNLAPPKHKTETLPLEATFSVYLLEIFSSFRRGGSQDNSNSRFSSCPDIQIKTRSNIFKTCDHLCFLSHFCPAVQVSCSQRAREHRHPEVEAAGTNCGVATPFLIMYHAFVKLFI
jgi:hypothetical protein